MVEKLERKFGLWSVVCIGIGATIGSGIFSTFREVAIVSQTSLILVLAFAIGGFMQIPANFCYAELSSSFPEDGGFYVYIREAGAKNLAFFCGWAAFWLIEPPSISLMSIALSQHLNWLIPIDEYILRLIPAAIILFFTFLNIRSVKAGSIVQVIFTIIKILPFIFVIGVGMFFLKTNNYFDSSFYIVSDRGDLNVAWILALLAAVANTTFSFEGLYAPSYLTGEVKNPKKTMPLAFLIMTVIIIVLYVDLAVVSCGLLSRDELAISSAPIADVSARIPMIGGAAGVVIAIVAVVVIIGTISSATIYMPRITYAMARDGYFFKLFGNVHPKYKSPYFAIICNSLWSIVLIFAADLSILLSAITFVTLLRNFSTFSSIFFLRRKSTYKPAYKCPLGLFFPILASSMSFIMLVGIFISAPVECLVWLFLLFGTGSVAFYFWTKAKNKDNN